MVFCKQENQFFCSNCDALWHSETQHLRKPVEENPMGKENHKVEDFEDDQIMKFHLHDRLALKDYESLLENFQKSDDWYGKCLQHGKREFEFYCFDCCQPLCAMCIIENKTKDSHFQHDI